MSYLQSLFPQTHCLPFVRHRQAHLCPRSLSILPSTRTYSTRSKLEEPTVFQLSCPELKKVVTNCRKTLSLLKAAATLVFINNMFAIRASLTFILLATLALASAIPHAHQKVLHDNDDFLAKKPMHTTDLMAGKARTTIKSSFTHTRIPTPNLRIRTSNEEMNEL